MSGNIFIIDKDANTLFSLNSKLSEAGFKVKADHSFCDIEIVIQKLLDFETKLLILDIDHSFWNWIDLLSEVRSNENLQELITIVYSFNNELEIEKRVLNVGADYFFSKKDLLLDDFLKKIINIYKNLKTKKT